MWIALQDDKFTRIAGWIMFSCHQGDLNCTSNLSKVILLWSQMMTSHENLHSQALWPACETIRCLCRQACVLYHKLVQLMNEHDRDAIHAVQSQYLNRCVHYHCSSNAKDLLLQYIHLTCPHHSHALLCSWPCHTLSGHCLEGQCIKRSSANDQQYVWPWPCNKDESKSCLHSFH